ncbi:hypothetical protein ACWEOH_10690 [Agromyces sp. NPDC004153]
MTGPNHCDFSAADFRATAIESSAGRLIRVTGSGLCPTSGWELRLIAANPGGVPHPETLWLELREFEPRKAPRVVTETTVEAIVEDSRAREIVLRFGWREGFTIPVVAASMPRSRRAARRASDAAKGRLAASAV